MIDGNIVVRAQAMDVLRLLPDESIDLVVTDPPYNTGTVRKSSRGVSYADRRDDYLEWLRNHIVEIRRVLKPTGSMYVHMNERSGAYVRCFIMDPVFGEVNHLNTIVWAFNYGGRGKKKFPAKHELILAYAKDARKHVFNWEDIDRVPYLAPGLQKDRAKALRGQVPTDVWWFSIVGTRSHERTSYPTQKNVKLAKRMIVASAPRDGIVLDPFAGSGTTGAAAWSVGRNFIMIDENEAAEFVMQERFSREGVPATFFTSAEAFRDRSLVANSENIA
jgi:site-specific DNA-methyltransferase (adenine-specific)